MKNYVSGFLVALALMADDGTVARSNAVAFPGTSYMEATLSDAQGTNIGAGDHVKFDVKRVEGGTLITLDTSTSYVNTQNTASIGRFTLTGGHTYRIIFSPRYAGYSGGGFINWGLWNSDDAEIIGQTSSNPAATYASNSGGDGTLTAYYTPATNKRIEVRLIGVGSLSAVGLVSTYNYFPTILIENIN